ncbi:MAG TPA: glucose-1-phosphate adenylyltransferase [Planctomycetota bacterium]|nr:glucose-1-phosphate adenylyltransferase [Planctomycetota bacterium]
MPDNLLKNTLTLVLAGGQGERLYPLTRDRAKPAVPFGGIYRIIDFTLSNCLNSGCQRVYVLTQYKSFSLDRHIMLGWSTLFNNPEIGNYIHILPPQQRTGQTWYLGTADAIYQNVYTLERERPERVLILGGDHIYKMNYAEMVRYHIERGADLTISCINIPKSEANQFGVAIVDKENRIQGFVEKPRENPPTVPNDPESCFASMGIYVFSTEALVRRISQDARRESAHDFGKNIIPEMVAEKARVFAYPFKDENKKEIAYWRDVGTIDSYYDANIDLTQVNPLFNLYDEHWPLRTYREQFPPAKFVFNEPTGDQPSRRGTALDSLVSSGVIVSGGTVERCVLSPQVRINSYSHVSESILMEGVSIGRHAKIRRAIIDKGVRIPEGTTIGYDADADRSRFTVTANGVVVVPKEMPLE